jgi:hypothetical protein
MHPSLEMVRPQSRGSSTNGPKDRQAAGQSKAEWLGWWHRNSGPSEEDSYPSVSNSCHVETKSTLANPSGFSREVRNTALNMKPSGF